MDKQIVDTQRCITLLIACGQRLGRSDPFLGTQFGAGLRLRPSSAMYRLREQSTKTARVLRLDIELT